MRQLVKGIAALTLTVGLLVGVPALLVELVGWPLPTRLPNLDEISLAFRSGINPDLLINTLAVVCWIFWAQLTIAIAVETIAVIRGRTAQRLRLMAGLQPAAARLVATVTLIAASLTPIRPAVAAPAPAPPVVVAVTPHEHHVSSPPTTPIQLSLPETAATEQKEPTGQVYVAQRLDTWWRIAETQLGDGRQWRQLRAHNIGVTTPDGETITATTEHIPAGTRLHVLDNHIPASNTSPSSPTVRNQVTVVSGDNFWTIAANALTDTWGRTPTDAETADYWQQLIETNRHRLQPPHDPDLIYPGQTFHLPPIPADPLTVDHANNSGEVDLVVVEDGDSFWTIAATTLTDTWGRIPTDAETADYWRQLVEANRHRLEPPYDPDLIYPGQTFQLPPIPGTTTQPADTDRQRPTPSSPSVPAEAVAPAPHLSAPAEPRPTPEPEQPAEPDRTAPPEPSQISPVQDPPADDASDTPIEEDTNTDGWLPTAAPLAGLGVLAAGVVLLINRLRSIQIRRRQPNTLPTPPPAETRQTENILRAAAAPAAAELVDLALRSLANHTTQTPWPQPQVAGVHIEPNQLRLLLATPNHHPPEEWTVDDDGRSWILPTDIDTTHLHLTADTTPAPYPTLITIGHTPTSQLLFNLEHAGATRITGQTDQVQATLETIAVELASSHTADTLDIICVGFGHHLEHLERIRVVQTIDGLLPSLESQTAALAAQGRATPIEGRLAAWGGDSWTPTVILDPRPNPPTGADRILAAAHAGLAVVAVVGYPTGGHYQLEINENTVTLHPMGRTYDRRNLTPTETSHIAAITKTAKNLDGMPPAELEPDPQKSPINTGPELQTEPDRLLLYDRIDYDVTVPADIEPPPAADPEDEPSDIATTTPSSPSATPVVKVLGPIHVDGPTAEPLRPRSLEIVTFLALHPNGVDTDRLTEAIWPDQAPISSRLNNAVFRARTQFGTSPAGDPYLPHGSKGFYQLHPDITTDLHQLHHHVDEAKKATNRSSAADHLQKALQLVQGPPFTGVHSGYGWVHTEGHSTHTIVAVDNTAHQLAEYALGKIQPDLATWASRQGLLASWSCEECYRNLMKAALLRNDYTAFDAIYAELTALVDADHGPDENGWLDPETADLYEKHRRGRKPDS